MRRATVVARITTSNSDLRRVLQAQNLTTIPLITCLLFKGKCKITCFALSFSVSVCLSLCFFFVWWVRLVRYLFHSCSERRRESGGDFLRDSSISKDFLKLFQKFQGFLIREFQAHFPSLCNAKVQGFIILEFPRHIHTYFQSSLHSFFISSGYQLWPWRKVEFLCWIVSALVALLYFNPAQFFSIFVWPCSSSEFLWGKQMKNWRLHTDCLPVVCCILVLFALEFFICTHAFIFGYM